MIEFWTAVLALTIFLYITLDGFDLGVGMLIPLVRDEGIRDDMLAAIAPVWDGNETWLVLNAAILFGVFPLTYATLLSAFYLPLIFMLGALILRGVAFEYRGKSEATRRLWDLAFVGGSYLATFLQGTAVGALVHGLPMRGTRYAGGALVWLTPFALLCGLGLCIGYALLGAGWLTIKSSPRVQSAGFRLMPRLLAALVLFLIVVFITALAENLQVMHRWLDTPALYIFPLIGLAGCVAMLHACRKKQPLTPFLGGTAIFVAAFGTLAVSYYPYMIPYAITTTMAASPPSSLAFLFWGAGVIVMPITLIYTSVIYFMFKGRVSADEDAY